VTLRSDHIAGGVFVAFGLLVFALSGDLPVGTLSFPGAGMMPKLVAGLVILFGLLLILRANESAPFATVRWEDLPHAARIVAITAAAIALYQTLGFLVTMTLLLFALTFGAERRHPLAAAPFSIGVVALTYLLFAVALKTPLEPGILGFSPWARLRICCSASRARSNPTCCGTRFSDAWSAPSSAYCPASDRSPASAFFCLRPSGSTPPSRW